MRHQTLALTAVLVVGSVTVEAVALTDLVNAAAYAAPSLLAAEPLAQSEDRAQSDRGERRLSAAAREREVCKATRLVDRGHPGKGDAVYETFSIECPPERSVPISAPQLCGQTILVKRGYPGQGNELLERAEIRCAEAQSALPPDTHRADADRETKLCEAHTLVRRGDPGQGEDLFRTVLVDCPADRS